MLWGFELGDDCSCSLAAAAPGGGSSASSSNKLSNAPGFLTSFVAPLVLEDGKAPSTEDELARQNVVLAMRKKRMAGIGQSPGKSIFMTAFMLYMSGSQLNIFSIMMTSMAVMNPVKSLLSMPAQFAPFSNVDGLLRAQATFVFLNGVALSFAVYKLAMMGLVPVQSTDWIAFVYVKEPKEMLGELLQ